MSSILAARDLLTSAVIVRLLLAEILATLPILNVTMHSLGHRRSSLVCKVLCFAIPLGVSSVAAACRSDLDGTAIDKSPVALVVSTEWGSQILLTPGDSVRMRAWFRDAAGDSVMAADGVKFVSRDTATVTVDAQNQIHVGDVLGIVYVVGSATIRSRTMTDSIRVFVSVPN